MMGPIEAETIDLIETQRLKIQGELDALKTQAERNRLGQFATPTTLATNILEYAKTVIPEAEQIRFLDPAFGTGSFYAALLRSFSIPQIAKAWGYEIDPHYGQAALNLWSKSPLELKIVDFTQVTPPESENNRANLLICNPPYVRHHHLSTSEKARLQMVVKQMTGLKLNGLAGLYCYFLLMSHEWMSEGGLAGWLIPSEFMDVNYGQQVKQYLLRQVTLLHIHRFNLNEGQFGDALVSSAVVWFKKEKPPANHQVEFSYGGSLTEPEIARYLPAKPLHKANKWTKFPEISPPDLQVDFNSKTQRDKLKLSDLFVIKRGLVTGANKFFILTPEQIIKHKLPKEFFIPILPSPRYLPTDEVEADAAGYPILDQQLFLLTCELPEIEVKTNYPSLWAYLQTGVQQGIPKRYLCRNRSPWYAQEKRPASPLLCTYMGRQIKEKNKPFRFILNYSNATAPNVYLMLYPKPALEAKFKNTPGLSRAVWQALNQITPEVLIGEGRVYGGGLHKIEPNELANTPADKILAVLPELVENYTRQLSFLDKIT